jgi:Spy/CpxP family protein refolding chaperone
MSRLKLLFGVAAVALGIVGLSIAQDKKDAPTKGKGAMPTFFKSLGLSEEQKDKVRKVHTEFSDKIADLKAKIKDLEQEEKAEYDRILTEDQRKRYREAILASKGVGEGTTRKDDSKKDDAKKDDGKKEEKK